MFYYYNRDNLSYVKNNEIKVPTFLSDEFDFNINEFKFSGPKNYKVYFWIETYVEGKLNEDLSFTMWNKPAENEINEGTVRFSRLDPDHYKEESRWRFFLINIYQDRWVEDPFEDYIIKTENITELKNIESDETYILSAVIGLKEDKEFDYTDKEEIMNKNDVVQLLKVNFTKRDNFEVVGTGASEIIPPEIY